MNIEFRDATTHYPRMVRRTIASLGQLDGRGKNKTEAKANLLEQVEAQLGKVFNRSYLICPTATFCLYYAAGWRYDIVPMSQSSERHVRASTTCMGDDLTEREAFEKMEQHFNHYKETA